MLAAYRALRVAVGPSVHSLGVTLEKTALRMGPTYVEKQHTSYPIDVRIDARGYEYDFYPELKEPEPRAYFCAPSAKLDGEVDLPPGASVWYHAQVTKGSSGPLHIGEDSCLQDYSVVSADAKVGSNTIIGPHAEIKAGASVGDCCVIGARAVIGANAVIEPNVVVGEGAVVLDGQVLESGRLYAGETVVGAEMVRVLDAEEIGSISELAAEVTVAAKTHELEWSKGPQLRDLERQEFKDRINYAESLLEHTVGHTPFVHRGPVPTPNPERSGLIYDKNT